MEEEGDFNGNIPEEWNEIMSYTVVPPTTGLQTEMLDLIRESGLSEKAQDCGLMNPEGTEIPALRNYSNREELTSGRRRKLESDEQADPDPLDNTQDDQDPQNKKKRKVLGKNNPSEKLSKGLRHFSLKVCEKVERNKITTYNEVANELVTEFSIDDATLDQKNIRRRVYDALNVLMAMDIISKEKKEIRWIGLPTNAKQEIEELEAKKVAILERIKKKKANYQELLSQDIGYKNLVKRNTFVEFAQTEAIDLPFIIVNTRSTTVIECEVADDRTAYFFNFTMPFEIHDDSEILKRMELVQPSMLPDIDQVLSSIA